MAIDELQNGRYRYLRILGSGGMGEVYLMRDSRVSRQVAIKVLRAEGSLYADDEAVATSTRLFEREARAIAALDHPNILPLYDFGEETREGVTITYMVMPYCADGSLEGWLRQRGRELLTPRQVAALIEQAADALQYAHEHEVIHLDVKPSNFLIRGNRKDPQRPILLLADFGIARNFSTVSSSSRTIRGTPTAMSPEQWSGEPVFASDQYALAIMAYEMLVGRPPFTGTMEQLMFRHFTLPAPQPSSFNPHLPAALDEVLQRALSKKPEERFPSIADFASALTEAAKQPAAYAEAELASYGTLTLSPSEAEAGISRMLTLESGEEVTVSVPAGAQDGQILRVQGGGSSTDQEAGVVLVNIAVKRPEKVRSVSEQQSKQGSEMPSVNPGQGAQNQQVVETSLRQTPPPAPEPLHLQPLSSSTSASAEALDPDAPTPVAVSEHDLPTLISLGNIKQITQAPLPVSEPVRTRKRPGLLALIALLIVLFLLGGLIAALVIHQSPALAGVGSTPTSVAQIALTATPGATQAPSPTTPPGLYIAGTYNGTLQSSTTYQTTALSVHLIQKNGSGILAGTVTFNSSNQQSYSLKGTVDMQGAFTFTVQQPGGLPYIFYGAVQAQVNLHGNYCRAATPPCQTSEGYFTVGPRY